ncbi:hypothetical protein EIP91_011877, partial [Steccherinum ochraceum]
CMDVADWADPALGKDTRRADLSIFKSDPASKKFWSDPKFEPGDKCSEARRPHTAHNCVSQAVCGGEVKMKSDKNGFGMTGKEPFLPESTNARQTRAQICGYAADILNHQQRTFVLMFYVYRTHARLLLVDRGAVLVSQPIDLEKNHATFAKFFYCLKTAPDAGLGYDPTANMLPKDPGSNADYKALQEALTGLPAISRLTPHIKTAFADGQTNWPYYKIAVVDKKTSETHHFLIRNPTSYSLSLTGRATKGYIAFDVVTKSFHFLKDSWRPDSPLIHPELKIYEDLAKSKVRFVATVRCGGDVRTTPKEPVQQTQSHIFRVVAENILSRIHTRLVLEEIGIPLHEYRDSKELCTAVGYALIAHMDAYNNAKILHRDISDGNIVLYEVSPGGELVGRLIDWDLCKYREELEKKPTQKSRSGTWRFISAMLLNYPLRANQLADDLESFYHLLLLFALRFHRHDRSAPTLIKEVLLVYDHHDFRHGYWVGGKTKFSNVRNGVIPFELEVDDRFKLLLQSLAALFKEHYASKDHVKLKECYGIPALQEEKSSDPASTYDATDPYPDESPSDSVFSELTGAEDDVHFYRTLPEARPSSRLEDHKVIVRLVSQALAGKGTETGKGKTGDDGLLARWTPGDKLNKDGFESIDWSMTQDFTGSWGSSKAGKRARSARSVVEEGRHNKKSKNSTDNPLMRQTRSASMNHVPTGVSSLEAHPEED